MRKTLLVSGRFPIGRGEKTNWDFAFLASNEMSRESVQDVKWVALGGHWNQMRKLMSPELWYHFCISFNYPEKRLIAYVNGEVEVDSVDKYISREN